MPLQAVSRRHVKVILKRVGDNITISRPDGNETRNKFHKKDDTDITFQAQDTDEYAYILDEQSETAIVDGGRADEQDTGIVLKHDTVAQEGDRLDFPDGREFHVNNMRDYDAYKIAVVVLDTS